MAPREGRGWVEAEENDRDGFACGTAAAISPNEENGSRVAGFA